MFAETIENNVQHIVHLANVRENLRFNQRIPLVFFDAQRDQLDENQRDFPSLVLVVLLAEASGTDQALLQELQTEIFHLDRRITKALETFFESLTFDAQRRLEVAEQREGSRDSPVSRVP